MFNDSTVQQLHLSKGVGAWGITPPKLSEVEERFLDAAMDGEEEVQFEMSWLCNVIVRHQALFHEIAVGLAPDGDYWLVLFAKELPRQVTFLELRRQPRVLTVLAPRPEQLRPNRREYAYLGPTEIRTERDLPFPLEDADIYVRHVKLQGLRAVSPHEPMLLEVVVAGRAPNPARPERAARAARPRCKEADVTKLRE